MANEIFMTPAAFLPCWRAPTNVTWLLSKVFAAATLLKARGKTHLIERLFKLLDRSRACRVEWTDSERFDHARTYFLKHADQPWSFTDCLSFCVMSRSRIRDALTKDSHFEHAGFVALLR
jgi:predicted nucleic acid-binding protein